MHGLSALAALTAQHTRGVTAVHVPPPGFLDAQIDACFDDFRIGAVKLGMLASTAVIETVARALERHQPAQVVVDPVMVATTGARLLEEDALDAMRRRLLPLATVITPNLPEAELLLGWKIDDLAAMSRAASALRALGAPAVMLKGGHLTGPGEVVDILTDADGEQRSAHPRLQLEAHGTGCTLASAVAANLARGLPLRRALRGRGGLCACGTAQRLPPRPRGRQGAGPFRLDAGPMSITTTEVSLAAGDGHRWTLLSHMPRQPRGQLLWLPALGVAARHYQPLAEALAMHGIATHLHEWRGNGSSSLRASHTTDWGYRELLALDLPASLTALPEDGTPRLLGGHSLGGQLACCLAGQHPAAFAGMGLVASGTPYWRTFPAPRGWLLPLVYRFLPWLARRRGALPGHRLGFGGNEARRLIADWARVGLTNRYAAAGLERDLEAGMAHVRVPVQAVLLGRDWLAPGLDARTPGQAAARTRADCLTRRGVPAGTG